MLIVKEKYILYFWLNRRHWDEVGVGHWEGCPDYYRINRGNCYGCLGSDEQRLTLAHQKLLLILLQIQDMWRSKEFGTFDSSPTTSE